MRINRLLASIAAVTIVFAGPTGRTFAQDQEFLKAWADTQRARPTQVPTHARIAPQDEPGTPLVIHGQLFASDGSTPVTDSIVFAWQTDRNGLYAPEGSPPHRWRLHGWARTDANGAFEFQTIRPGSYPSTRNPAHVHFSVETPKLGRYFAGELRFQDDALVPEQERTESEREGRFGGVRPVRREGVVQHVDFAIRLDPRSRF